VSILRARLRFERDFVQIPNRWLRDKSLSRRARGLLAEIMTHSEGWVITVEALEDNGPEGREALRSARAELVQAGYLKLLRTRADGGRLTGSTYILTDPDDPETADETSEPEPGADDESSTPPGDGFTDSRLSRQSVQRPPKKNNLLRTPTELRTPKTLAAMPQRRRARFRRQRSRPRRRWSGSGSTTAGSGHRSG
jgi:hypothetical protein